jgi:hypothetical protein
MPVKIFRGDTWNRVLELSDESEKPINLTGASSKLYVRDRSGQITITATTSNGYLTIDPTNGRVILRVPPSVTEELQIGTYKFDWEITFPGGDKYTCDSDTLIIQGDVTYD